MITWLQSISAREFREASREYKMRIYTYNSHCLRP
jgi:hypothetical protein